MRSRRKILTAASISLWIIIVQVCQEMNSFPALRLVELLNLKKIKDKIVSALIVLPDSELKKEKPRTVCITGFPAKLNPNELIKWICNVGNVERYWLEVDDRGNRLSLVMNSESSCNDLVELISSYPYGDVILTASKKAVYNCCIKNIPLSWNESKLLQYCSRFGKINASIMTKVKKSSMASVEFSSIRECAKAIACNNDEEKVGKEWDLNGRIRKNWCSSAIILQRSGRRRRNKRRRKLC